MADEPIDPQTYLFGPEEPVVGVGLKMPFSLHMPATTKVYPNPELVMESVEVMANALKSEDEAIRVAAARSIIDLSIKNAP